MDRLNYITAEIKHKRGKHLDIGNRHCIATMIRQGKSFRYIAKQLNCSPTTISNEIKRGIINKTSSRGRPLFIQQIEHKRLTVATEVGVGVCTSYPTTPPF